MNGETKSKIDYTKNSFNDNEVQLIKKEVDIIQHKYPTYIPIIVRTKDKSIKLTKIKYLVSRDITLGQLNLIIRKKLNHSIKPSHGIFIFVNNLIPGSSTTLFTIYHQYKDPITGMLFLTITKENTFGSITKN